MFNFNQKEDKFHQMIFESAQNVNEAAKILRKSLDSLDNKENNVNKIEELELKGDRLVHDVIKELNEAFITPIDREDIYELIKNMDNILDQINSTMHRFIMFNINKSTEELKLLSDMVVQATNEILELMSELKLLNNKSNRITERIVNINTIENNADFLFRQTVTELFKNEIDPLTVIKWKEIYQILENTVDNCEKVAHVVEGVVIKNA